MELRAPMALKEGAPLTGPIMCEYQPAQPTHVLPVAERGHRPYLPHALAEPTAVLRVSTSAALA